MHKERRYENGGGSSGVGIAGPDHMSRLPERLPRRNMRGDRLQLGPKISTLPVIQITIAHTLFTRFQHSTDCAQSDKLKQKEIQVEDASYLKIPEIIYISIL